MVGLDLDSWHVLMVACEYIVFVALILKKVELGAFKREHKLNLYFLQLSIFSSCDINEVVLGIYEIKVNSNDNSCHSVPSNYTWCHSVLKSSSLDFPKCGTYLDEFAIWESTSPKIHQKTNCRSMNMFAPSAIVFWMKMLSHLTLSMIFSLWQTNFGPLDFGLETLINLGKILKNSN